MNIVEATQDRVLLSVTREHLLGVVNALNEVCNGGDIDDAEFQTRLGVTRDELRSTLQEFSRAFRASDSGQSESAVVWRDEASVQVRAITAFGDPVDMSSHEARMFAAAILGAAAEADR